MPYTKNPVGQLVQSTLIHFKQALAFVWRSSPRLTIVQLALLVFQSALPLVNIYLLKLLIDAIEAHVKAGNGDFQPIIALLLAMGGVLLVSSWVATLATYVSTAQAQRVSDYMSVLLQEKSAAIDLQFYEDPQYHDTLHRAQTQGLYRPVQVLNSLVSTLQNGLSLTAVAGLFVLLHWGVALVFILTALPALAIRVYFSKVLYEWQRRTTQLERESYYLNMLLTNERYVKEIRVFDVAHIFIEKFKALRDRLYGEKLGIEGKKARAEVLARSAEIVATVGIYGFVAYRAAGGHLTVGDFVLYFQAFQKGQSSLKSMLNSMASLYENRLFLKYIFEFLQIEPQVSDQPSALPLPRIAAGIRFEGVSFAYPSSREGKRVLHDIDLNIPKGKVVALVGENGSGKTTLIKLLARLYDVTDGRITFDGTDIRAARLSDVRQRISVIFQDFSKYYLSVQDNIQVSNMHDPLDAARARFAAQQTGAHEFIEDLPEGYANMLGLRFLKGTELSGGQWQKIALSRAFYKEADIIVLDEPTSAIDPIAEYELFERLRDIARDKILILITHRLYNLKMADEIVVMEQGRIIERGTHSELAQARGQYFKMFEKQLAD